MSVKGRTIKLYCPSVSKLVPFVALEAQKLDLGTIARAFGLDPATLKLNGHFLSRGVDLISCVTWSSLLSFFSRKGFSTGNTDENAIIVDGKPDLHKGDHLPCNSASGTCFNGVEDRRKPDLEDLNPSKRQKIHIFSPVNSSHIEENRDVSTTGKKRKIISCETGFQNSNKRECPDLIKNSPNIKRKARFEDFQLCKKLKYMNNSKPSAYHTNAEASA